MKILVAGSTNPSIDLFLGDDSGLPVSGKTYSNFPTTYYSVGGAVAKTAITFASLASESTAYTSGGLIERSNGWYRLDLPVAAVATAGVNLAVFSEGTGLHLYCAPIWISAGTAGYMALDWAQIANKTTANNLSSTLISSSQSVGASAQWNVTSDTTASATATTITGLVALGTDNLPVGCLLKMGSGTGALQVRIITAYSNATRTYTIHRAWDVTPTAGSTFSVIVGQCPTIDSSLQVSVGNTSALASAVWSSATRTMTSFGSLISDFWSASTRSLTAFSFVVDTRPNATESAIQARTDNLPASPASEVNATANLNTILGSFPTNAAIANAVWNVLVSSITTAESIGTRLLSFLTGYSAPPSPDSIAQATAGRMLVDGVAHKLKVNADGTVNADDAGIAIENYITIPAAIAATSQESCRITCLRGDTLRVSLPLLGNITNWTKLVLTVKRTVDDDDTQSVIQVVAGMGLMRLNGQPSANTSAGSLSINDVLTGAVDLVLQASCTARLMIEDDLWDVQVTTPAGVLSPACGTFSVIADVTRSID